MLMNAHRQRGMVLLVSLVFLLLITLIGVSAWKMPCFRKKWPAA